MICEDEAGGVDQMDAAMSNMSVSGQPQYGAPQGQYGAPQGQYGAPQGQYGAPQGQYGAPQGQYGPQGAAPRSFPRIFKKSLFQVYIYVSHDQMTT